MPNSALQYFNVVLRETQLSKFDGLLKEIFGRETIALVIFDRTQCVQSGCGPRVQGIELLGQVQRFTGSGFCFRQLKHSSPGFRLDRQDLNHHRVMFVKIFVDGCARRITSLSAPLSPFSFRAAKWSF